MDGFPGSEWFHLTCVAGAGKSENTIYINGIKTSSAHSSGKSGTAFNLARDIILGHRGPGGINEGYLFRGAMDNVRIYSAALSADEVLALYKIEYSPVPGSLGYKSGPVDQYVAIGRNAELAVEAGPDVEYQWFRYQQPLGDTVHYQ